MLSFTASYFLMLPYLHNTMTLQKHAAPCCLVLLLTFLFCLTKLNTIPPKNMLLHADFTTPYILTWPYLQQTLPLSDIYCPIFLY